MALTTYTGLKAEVADWLNRTDLTTQIPTFIALAEAKMQRKIRKWTTRDSAFSIDAEHVAVPTDLLTPRSIRLVTGSPTQDVPMRLGTMEMVSERKARAGGTTGRPDTVAVIDGFFYFAPEPDQTYTAELLYFSTFTALSASNASNAVLVEAPDAYLYGALMHAAPFLEHDERAAMWKPIFYEAIDDLNALREEYEFSATIRDVRLARVFG